MGGRGVGDLRNLVINVGRRSSFPRKSSHEPGLGHLRHMPPKAAAGMALGHP